MKKGILIVLTLLNWIACSYSKEEELALDRAVAQRAHEKGYVLISYFVRNDSDTATGFNLYFIRMEVDSAGMKLRKNDTIKLYKTLDGILLVPGDTLLTQE